MADPRQSDSLFELTVPPKITTPVPAQTESLFDLGLTPQPTPGTGTGASGQLGLSESSTLFGTGKAETVLGEFAAGLQSGTRQFVSTAPALVGLANQWLGDPETAASYLEWSRQIAEGGAKRGIGKVEDLTLDPVSWARYVSGVTGEAVPFILSILGGAGAGSTFAKLLTRSGVASSHRALILNTAPVAGAFGTAASIETGATAQELFSATGKVEPLASLTAGAAKGALESLFPLILARQFGLTIGQAEGLYGRLLSRVAGNGSTRLGRIGTGIATEAGTEAAQEEIDILTRSYFDENYNSLSPDAWSRRLNATVAGGVGGGVFSAMTPSDASTALQENVVRDAVNDTPIVYGSEVNELPSTSPEEIINQSAEGLDITAGVATGTLLDQMVGEVDLRKRGLYGAVTEGRDITFGTQDQANNDYDYYQGSGFLRLDPNRIKRGDITASVEDLPVTVNDSRVEFLDEEQLKPALAAFTEAIKINEKAKATPNLRRREALLGEAERAYRTAVDLGVRVEPLVDGQVILRDPKKLELLAETQATVSPQLTEATLLDTRTRPGGQKFYTMQAGTPKARKLPGGKAIDLENIDPRDVTAYPSQTLQGQVLATPSIGRRLSVSAARARGIRFLPGTQNETQLLQDFVNFLARTSLTKTFRKAPGTVVEDFMKLVDRGLRLDVAPDTVEFAVLRQVRETELQDPNRGGPLSTFDPGSSRVIKQRAKRKREPAVTRRVGFTSENLENLFYSQFHNTFFQRLVTGVLKGGKKVGDPYVQEYSPISNMLRDLAKSMHLKTDIALEIVPPGTLDGRGVVYDEAHITTAGGKQRAVSFLRIDPWFYGRPTLGGKKLTKGNPQQRMFAERRRDKDNPGRVYGVLRLTPTTFKKVKHLLEGETLEAYQAANPGVTHVLVQFDPTNPNKQWASLIAQGDQASVEQAVQGSQFAEVGDVNTEEAKRWREAPIAEQVQVPESPQRLSQAGKYARKFGVEEQKFHTTDEEVAAFYADFSFEFGKLIIAHEWGNLTAGEQNVIDNAYMRERNAARSLSRQAALSRVFAHPVLAKVIDKRGKKGDLYTKEEWIASHIARALANPVKGFGPVMDFFKKTAGYVRKFLFRLLDLAKATGTSNIYNLDPAKGQAHVAVERWVERLVARGLDKTLPDESFLSEPTRKALLESIDRNREALAGWNLSYAVASPEKASTVQVRKLLDFVPKERVEDIAKLKALLAVADTHNTTLEWGLGIHQLSQLNPHIVGLRDYVTLTRAMENEAVSWATLADNRLRQAQKLPRVQQEALWKLMDSLDRLVYLDPKKLESGEEFPRWPTAEELLRLTKQFKMSQEAFNVYREIRKDYLYFLSYMETTGIRNVEETIVDPDLRKERIAEIRAQIGTLRNRPYFPHMRFGKYAVTIRNNKREVVFFRTYDTVKSRTADLQALIKRYDIPKKHSIVEDEMSEVLQQFQGLPKFALQNVEKALGLDAAELTEQQKKDRDLLQAMALEHTPQESFRRRMMHRENTAGYSMDGMRSYAHYFAKSARFIARMHYADRLQNSIKDVRRTASPISKDTRTRIADFMHRHYDANMNPAMDLATLRSLAFTWYFAFVPAAAFVNLTQLPMVTGPYLAGKFGDAQTGAKMISAVKSSMDEYFKWMRTGEVADTPKQEAIDQAHDDRLIDDGFATELAAISHGSVLSRTIAGNKFQRAVRMVAQWGTAPFAFAERVNRAITFRAAYDLALKNPDHPFVNEVMVTNKAEADRLRAERGWDDRQVSAYLVGAQAVRDTQFEYSRWARPKIFNEWRGVLFMFKSYLQNMLWFMYKSNRGTQARFMLALLGIAGVIGLPGADDMNAVVKWISKQLGYPVNPEMFLRKLLVEHLGATGPDIFLHGASRVGFGVPQALGGLGIPSPKLDLSGALSMGRLVPGLSAGLNSSSASFTETVGDLTREVAGPVLGVPFSLAQALVDKSLPADDIKRWERVMPRAAKAVSRSSRLLAEQRERDRGGATILEFDPNDLSDQMDILAIGLGFQPTQLSRQWDYIEARKEVENYWKAQRTLLMSEFFRAVRLKDPEGRDDAIKAIRVFNKEVPYKGMGITRDSLSRSVQQRRKSIRLREEGLPAEKALRPLTRELQTQFPEIERRKVR